MIKDNLNKRPEPTIPKDINDPPRFAQPVETTKDVFIDELKGFFDRSQLSSNVLEEVPIIRKFDFSFKSTESSHETAVKIIRKFPDIDENLPLVAILGTTGRNISMGIGGGFVSSVAARTFVTSINSEPFALATNQTLIYRTIDPQKNEYTSTVIFRDSRFANIAQATAQEVVDEINFQALYAKASVAEGGKINLAYGGGLTHGISGDIIIGDDTGDAGTAAVILGFTPGQQAEYISTTPFNRYVQATALDVGIEVVAENDNVRTELCDLIWAFFTVYMDERDFTFLGRSIFDLSIPNEAYQVIIKPDLSMAGENEVPRPGDDVDKLYVNRLNIPITIYMYTDRAVTLKGTIPYYLDAENITYDEDIPQKN